MNTQIFGALLLSFSFFISCINPTHDTKQQEESNSPHIKPCQDFVSSLANNDEEKFWSIFLCHEEYVQLEETYKNLCVPKERQHEVFNYLRETLMKQTSGNTHLQLTHICIYEGKGIEPIFKDNTGTYYEFHGITSLEMKGKRYYFLAEDDFHTIEVQRELERKRKSIEKENARSSGPNFEFTVITLE